MKQSAKSSFDSTAKHSFPFLIKHPLIFFMERDEKDCELWEKNTVAVFDKRSECIIVELLSPLR